MRNVRGAGKDKEAGLAAVATVAVMGMLAVAVGKEARMEIVWEVAGALAAAR